MRPIRHIGREHTASPGWPLSGLDGQWLLLAESRQTPSLLERQHPFRFVRHLPGARTDAVNPRVEGRCRTNLEGGNRGERRDVGESLWRLKASSGAVKVRSMDSQRPGNQARAGIDVDRHLRRTRALTGTWWYSAQNTS